MNTPKREGLEDYVYGDYNTNTKLPRNWNTYNQYGGMNNNTHFNNQADNTRLPLNSNDKSFAAFNYDSLYNTSDLTQKYSFLNSSFIYRPFSTNDNDYLSQVYYNNNPLEVEHLCSKLDPTTCGLTSSCVYVGQNKCVPGNIQGPYTSYSDINVDYYYYKGKCHGNCPGQFYPNQQPTTSSPVNTTRPTSFGTPMQTSYGTPMQTPYITPM